MGKRSMPPKESAEWIVEYRRRHMEGIQNEKGAASSWDVLTCRCPRSSTFWRTCGCAEELHPQQRLMCWVSAQIPFADGYTQSFRKKVID